MLAAGKRACGPGFAQSWITISFNFRLQAGFRFRRAASVPTEFQ
jgi:hypothetical protein